MTKSRGIRPPRQHWTDDQVKALVRLYPDTPAAEIAAQLGVTVQRVYSKAESLGLKKSAAYLASPAACRLRRGDNVGAATRFQKGLTPWNKGTHYTAGGRSAETRFQKGHRGGKAAKLYQPIGTERISKDGYLERKVNDDMPLQKRWRAVHLLVWEAANGPLPAGHAVCFLDGDKRNISLDNLELVTRAELMRRNTVHKLPKDVALAVQMLGALRRQINNREDQT